MAAINKKRLLGGLCIAVVIGGIAIAGLRILNDKPSIAAQKEKTEDKSSKDDMIQGYSSSTTDADNSSKDNEGDLVSGASGDSNAPVTKQDEADISSLKKQIEALCKGNGEWSVYIKDLKSDRALSINNKKMVSASVIKLFIMAAVYDAVNNGEIKKDKSVDGLLKNMITVSDNASSNKLVELLGKGNHEKGMTVVNEYAKSIGCLDTEIQRKFYDVTPASLKKENYTSVLDCEKLLYKIYNKQCVSPELDKEMLKLLLAQERNTKLPALLPKGAKIAHKTGELTKVENDVGIVYGPKTDYIICVMSNDVNSEEARKLISKISKLAYDYFE